MACKNLTEALIEDVIEITWMFDGLVQSKIIKSWDEICEHEYGSDGIKNTIKNIAQKFEKKYPFETTWEDSDLDCIEEIEKFAKEKLVEKFGSTELQENKEVIGWVEGAMEHYGVEDIEVSRDGDKTEMISVYTDCSVYGECVAQYDKCDIEVLKKQLEDMGISEDL